jgi:hypothetical protein
MITGLWGKWECASINRTIKEACPPCGGAAEKEATMRLFRRLILFAALAPAAAAPAISRV